MYWFFMHSFISPQNGSKKQNARSTHACISCHFMCVTSIIFTYIALCPSSHQILATSLSMMSSMSVAQWPFAVYLLYYAHKLDAQRINIKWRAWPQAAVA